MRKLFATILAIALVGVMCLSVAMAKDTEVTGMQDDGNGSVYEALKAAPEGSKLIITCTCTSLDSGATANWGIGGLCTDGTWTVNNDFGITLAEDPVLDASFTKEFDVATVLAAATEDVKVNLYNGYKCTKVVISSPDAAEDPKTEDPKTEDPKTEDPKTEDPTPKTADTMVVVAFAAIALLALGGVVASKKARA